MTDDLSARVFERAVEVEDLTIRSDGTGRTVEAYAAAYGVPTEIRDADGHYTEVIKPGAFRRSIETRGTNFSVLYNHGRALDGRADGYLTVPIAVPVEVRDTDRGVFTAVEFLDNPLADSVLGAIKQRAIRGYSFSGRFVDSTRVRPANRGELPTIERNKADMREFGPVLNPAYAAAEILGTRSLDVFLLEWVNADESARAELLGGVLPSATRGDGPDPVEAALAVVTDPVDDHSARQRFQALRLAARQKGVLS